MSKHKQILIIIFYSENVKLKPNGILEMWGYLVTQIEHEIYADGRRISESIKQLLQNNYMPFGL